MHSQITVLLILVIRFYSIAELDCVLDPPCHGGLDLSCAWTSVPPNCTHGVTLGDACRDYGECQRLNDRKCEIASASQEKTKCCSLLVEHCALHTPVEECENWMEKVESPCDVIEEHCSLWFDGCNRCNIETSTKTILQCTEEDCATLETPQCLEFGAITEPSPSLSPITSPSEEEETHSKTPPDAEEFSESFSSSKCCPLLKQPGFGENYPCYEDSTCCSDGTWACDDTDGHPLCPNGAGEVCSCCEAEEEPNYCTFGTTCCSNGDWECNTGNAPARCDEGLLCDCCERQIFSGACSNGATCCSNGIWECNLPSGESSCLEFGARCADETHQNTSPNAPSPVSPKPSPTQHPQQNSQPSEEETHETPPINAPSPVSPEPSPTQHPQQNSLRSEEETASSRTPLPPSRDSEEVEETSDQGPSSAPSSPTTTEQQQAPSSPTKIEQPQAPQCRDVHCTFGQSCVVYDGDGICVNSCDGGFCAHYNCRMVEEEHCFTEPCFDYPACSNPCDRVLCEQGELCDPYEGQAYCHPSCQAGFCGYAPCREESIHCGTVPCWDIPLCDQVPSTPALSHKTPLIPSPESEPTPEDEITDPCTNYIQPGCAPVNGLICPADTICKIFPEGECVPSNCVCTSMTGSVVCTNDCGGGTCEPFGSPEGGCSNLHYVVVYYETSPCGMPAIGRDINMELSLMTSSSEEIIFPLFVDSPLNGQSGGDTFTVCMDELQSQEFDTAWLFTESGYGAWLPNTFVLYIDECEFFLISSETVWFDSLPGNSQDYGYCAGYFQPVNEKRFDIFYPCNGNHDEESQPPPSPAPPDVSPHVPYGEESSITSPHVPYGGESPVVSPHGSSGGQEEFKDNPCFEVSCPLGQECDPFEATPYCHETCDAEYCGQKVCVMQWITCQNTPCWPVPICADEPQCPETAAQAKGEICRDPDLMCSYNWSRCCGEITALDSCYCDGGRFRCQSDLFCDC